MEWPISCCKKAAIVKPFKVEFQIVISVLFVAFFALPSISIEHLYINFYIDPSFGFLLVLDTSIYRHFVGLVCL